jgi:hypothetical protein
MAPAGPPLLRLWFSHIGSHTIFFVGWLIFLQQNKNLGLIFGWLIFMCREKLGLVFFFFCTAVREFVESLGFLLLH